MFENCTKLEEVNFSNFKASKVENMTRMFYNCKNVKYIDLNGFKIREKKNVDMGYMFYKCSSLASLVLFNSF